MRDFFNRNYKNKNTMELEVKTKESMFDKMFRSEFNYDLDYQKYLHTVISMDSVKPENRPNLIIPKSRQIRMTTTLLAAIVDWAKYTNRNLNIIFIVSNLNNAKEQSTKLKAIANKLGVKVDGTNDKVFLYGKNNWVSNIIFTSNFNYHGDNAKFDLAICDEFAFIKKPKETLGVLNTCSKHVIITSTPLKGSYFNELLKSTATNICRINSRLFNILDATYQKDQKLFSKERIEEWKLALNDQGSIDQEIYGKIL